MLVCQCPPVGRPSGGLESQCEGEVPLMSPQKSALTILEPRRWVLFGILFFFVQHFVFLFPLPSLVWI